MSFFFLMEYYFDLLNVYIGNIIARLTDAFIFSKLTIQQKCKPI